MFGRTIARGGDLETAMEQIDGKRQVYDAAHIARSGVFVILNHDGTLCIERSFMQPEDMKPDADATNAAGEGNVAPSTSG